jgi:hypothetical protein
MIILVLVIANILSSGRKLVRRISANRKRMHRMGNQIGDAVKHGSMPGQARQTCELLGHDQQRKVPAAGRCAGMAGMFRTIIGQLEHDRRERREPALQRGRHRACMTPPSVADYAVHGFCGSVT